MNTARTRVRDLPLASLIDRFSSGRVSIDYGAAVVRVRSRLSGFARDFREVYGAFALADEDVPFADYHVEMCGGRGLRTLLRPQSRFRIDGLSPMDPFPARNALPLFEWGVNWCFAQRFNQYVLLHSGALALGDRAVVMAAPPGSGKSTLAAAMMLSGFRLLSDEFGVLSPERGELLAMLKPVALKNESIRLIRAFSPEAVVGPLFTGTRKGDVAHLAPDEASVAALNHPARPALLLFPRYQAGAVCTSRPLSGEHAFARLAFNSFNYALLGPLAFDAVGDVVEHCPAYELRYGRLEEAVERVRDLLQEAPVAAPRAAHVDVAG